MVLHMNERDERIVRKFKALVSKRVKVREMRVFGSRARGEATEESDLDVLVIVESLDHAAEKFVSECAWEAGFPEDVVIVTVTVDLHAVTSSPIRNSVFIRHALHNGIPI